MEMFACLNGKISKESQVHLPIDNRAFLYGDGLFESIHVYGSKAPLMRAHLQRLSTGMALLQMAIPDYFESAYFTHLIERLCARNKLYRSVRVRLSVYRVSPGLYTPEKDEVCFLIQMRNLNEDFFHINAEGTNLGLYELGKKEINQWSEIKSVNAQLFVQAGIYKRQEGLDDCLILNRNNNVCESIGSNVFFVKDKVLHTPALSEGCLPGIMRNEVIQLAKSESIDVEEGVISKDLIQSCDEVFLTNAVKGIQWVKSYYQKRFYNTMAFDLSKKLNRITFE